LDLAKALTTTVLRGSLTPQEYLQAISKVSSRTEKLIQLRMLIGLLGLDPSEDTTPEICKILREAQKDDFKEYGRNSLTYDTTTVVVWLGMDKEDLVISVLCSNKNKNLMAPPKH
jgi:hypothetical protein